MDGSNNLLICIGMFKSFIHYLIFIMDARERLVNAAKEVFLEKIEDLKKLSSSEDFMRKGLRIGTCINDLKNILETMRRFHREKKPENKEETIDMDMMKALYTEFQKAIDRPNTTVEVLLDKFSNMMLNNQSQQLAKIIQKNNDKWEKSIEMIAGAFNRERPKDDSEEEQEKYDDTEKDKED